jgi:type II secretory pathway pseudopilin PulG
MPHATTRMVSRAAAEIAVILVGVLMALAVDRWAASLDDRTLEAQYLARLESDLRQDSAALEARVASFARRLEFAVSVVDVVEGRATAAGNPADFFARLERVAWFQPWSPDRDTWEELKATGRLDLIRSRDTRKLLSSYYVRLEAFAKADADFEDQFSRYEVPAWSLIPPRLRLQVFPGAGVLGEARVGPGPTEADVHQVTQRLKSDRVLYGAFVSLIQNLVASREAYAAGLPLVYNALASLRDDTS